MNPQNSPAAESDELDFVITRIFDAPRTLVFQAWTDPRHVTHWWGPKGFSNPVCQMDVRPGGAHRVVMRSPEGVDYPITGHFQEIVEPERIVMTMDCAEHPPEWHDAVKPNRQPGDNNPAGVMVQTVTFEDLNGKTKLTIRTRFKSREIQQAMLKLGMTEGWTGSLDRLAEVLAALQS